ncbi:MAG: phosphodiesterase [Solirubrobacterales bacterium]
MSRPFLLAQISDLHLGEPAIDGVKPKKSLRRVIAAIGRLPNPVDAVLVTGDLAEHAKPKEYRLAAELIGRLGVPVHVLPGNHDDRATMREALGLPGAGAEPLDYTADLGPLRLVVVDSTTPGEDHGSFEPGQLRRLDDELDVATGKPTIVAMHQPPLATGMPSWDSVNMPASERDALAAVIERHPQVRVIVAGHLHRMTTSVLAGRPVLAAPSTFAQARPDFAAEDVDLYGGAPGFVLHALLGDDLSSQVEILPG